MSAAQDKASMVVRETATEWVARLTAPDLSHSDKVAFAAWLRASPIHVREYLNVEALRAALEAAVHDDATDVGELLQDLPSNIVHLEPTSESAASMTLKSAPAISRWLPVSIAATALLVFGIAVTLVVAKRSDPNAYATTVGEIRKIPLPDGSTVELNTRSRIKIDFEANRRDIVLTEGEAFFSVAKDPQRPFRVLSDSAQIRAIGTQFSVYQKTAGTVVTVLEGKVVVSPAVGSRSSQAPDAGVIPLSAGQQTIIDSNPAKKTTQPMATAKATAVDATRATAWRHNRIIFDNQPLSAVIAEFNRYNRQQLVVEDPGLAAQGISGVFDPDKPQGLLLFLQKKGAVRATEVSDTTLLLTR